MEKFKLFLVAFGGMIATYFKAYIPLMVIVFIAVIFDFITGLVAAIYTGEGLNSKKARKGALKKATMFLALGFGIFLDYLIPYAAVQIGFTVNAKLMFSSVIAFYIAFTECVSVCENIYRCNPDAFPKWITKILTEGKTQLDKLHDTEGKEKLENLNKYTEGGGEK